MWPGRLLLGVLSSEGIAPGQGVHVLGVGPLNPATGARAFQILHGHAARGRSRPSLCLTDPEPSGLGWEEGVWLGFLVDGDLLEGAGLRTPRTRRYSSDAVTETAALGWVVQAHFGGLCSLPAPQEGTEEGGPLAGWGAPQSIGVRCAWPAGHTQASEIQVWAGGEA